MKGKLIVIAGTDGSGKATQTELLVKRLREEGHSVEVADFPRYDKEESVFVRNYLQKRKYGPCDSVDPKVASIFYAIDRYDASFQMRKWLEEGKIVIANRYASANKGHQGGKIKDTQELDVFLDWVDSLEYGIFAIPKPDINFMLHMPTDVVLKLKAKQREDQGEELDGHEDDPEHMKDAERVYLYMSEKYDYWVKIPCSNDGEPLSIEEINDLVYDKVKELI